MTFEKALDKLSAVVSQLEEGSLPLEKSLKLYEEGVSLATFCEGELQKASLRVWELKGSPAERKDEDESGMA